MSKTSKSSKKGIFDYFRRLEGLDFPMLFDVGANRGQSIEQFLAAYPSSAIHAFEPVANSYRVLQARFSVCSNVRLNECALGSAPKRVRIRAIGTATTNHILEDGAATPDDPTVSVIKGDDYCLEQSIEDVSYLKIDTEGYDLDVLVGFIRMISEGRIAFIQVEASMNPENTSHVPFSRFTGLLEPLGYRLFRITDQAFERRGRAVLRRSNVVFVNRKVYENYVLSRPAK